MGSYNEGKREVCAWIRERFDRDSKILDVGPSDGKWRTLLSDYRHMDAVEVWKPYADRCRGMYEHVYVQDIKDFEYDWYDLIILGDVIEHLTVEDAQKVIDYAMERCRDMIVAVPFLYKQGEVGGNPYEVHIQDDLTRELFEKRYKGLMVLCEARADYCYFHKDEGITGTTD